jgi:Zn-dependent protease
VADVPPVRKFECPACKYADYRMSTREIGERVQDPCPKCGAAMKVVEGKAPEWLSKVLGSVSKRFEIEDFVASGTRGEFEVFSPDAKRSFGVLLKDLKKQGCISAMRSTKGGPRLLVVKRPPIKPSRIWINMLLFATTFFSTFLAGYFFLFEGAPSYALAFSIAIMLMLGTHELGHMISAWRNGVEATAPYFIPFPHMLGTLGAVINIKSPPPSKDALVEMGVAGPLAGFAVALPLTIVGLLRSVPDPGGITLPIAPLIFLLLPGGSFSHLATGYAIHPLAFAGWVTMLLTMFNLLPAGQLDGGHVARGVLNQEHHYTLTRTIGITLIASGFFIVEFPFWVWGFLIFFMFRSYHTGALDDVSRLSRGAKLLALISAVVFFLCLPVPVG